MNRVSVRGVDLAVRDEGSGPPVVWMHGLTSSMADEDAGWLYGPPRPEGVRVIRYDARGHGASGSTGGAAAHSWHELAHDLLALADALDLGEFVAAGASMGAATAVHAALLAPHRVRGLVLTIPPTAWETRAEQVQRYLAGADLIASSGLATFADAMLAGPRSPLVDELGDLWIRHSRERLMSADPDVLATDLRGAARSDLPAPEAVATITAPALVLTWPDDPGHPRSTGERLATLLPDAVHEPAETLREVRSWSERITAWCRSLA
jgi:pimeloyl-ACP methyl ester carboxylesterase